MEIKHIVVLILSLFGFGLIAQTGGLYSETVTVVNPKDIQLDSAERVYSSANDYVSNTPNQMPEISFDFNYKPFAPTKTLPTKVAIYRLKIDKVDDSKSGFVRAGMGNYLNTLLDVYYGSKASKNFAWALSANHLGGLKGPIEKKLSGYSDNRLGLHSKYFMKNYVFSTSANYQRTVSRNYGALDNKNLFVNQTLDPKNFVYKNPTSDLFFDLGFKSINTKNPFQIEINTSPYFFVLNDSSSEFVIENKLIPSYKIKAGTIYFLAGLDYSNLKSSNNLSRTMVNIKPSFEHISDDKKFVGETGLIFNSSTDTTLDKKLSVYPFLKGSYLISKELELMVKGQLSGGLVQQNIKNNYRNNNWMAYFNPNTTNEKIAIVTSLEISPVSSFKAKLGLNYKTIDNFNYFSQIKDSLGFYTNTYTNDPVNLLNPNLELTYSSKSEHGAILKFNYYKYGTEDTLLYTPTLLTNLEIFYKLNKNIKLSTDISYISGLKGQAQKEMDSIIDFNLKASYDFNEKLGAFIHANNLVGKKYIYFEGYAVQGINIMGGLTLSF